MNRVLFVCALPLQHLDSGAKQRVYNLVRTAQNGNNQVYYLVCNHVTKKERAYMRKKLETPVFVYQPSLPAKLVRIKAWLRKKLPVAIMKMGISLPYGLDDWYPKGLKDYVKYLCKKFQINIVIAEYVFLSGALTGLGKDILKVIDTIDILADAQKPWLADGSKKQGIYMKPGIEKKGLLRADVVWAIQKEEAEYFQKILKGCRRVYTVGNRVDVHHVGVVKNKKVLFMGSDNKANHQAAVYLLEEIWPRVYEKEPEAELHIAGSVCNRLTEQVGCKLLGYVGNLDELYQSVRVVVNPVLQGTGLPIKTIEALAHTKPVVATSCGARGLRDLNGVLAVADDAGEFAEQLLAVLQDDQYAETFSERAGKAIEEYNRTITENISETFDMAGQDTK